MKKSELKELIRSVISEAIGLGVAETNMNESAPPDFPPALEKKLLKQYKDVPQKAYATMWKIHNAKNEGNQRVCEMWAAWESKGMNEVAGEQTAVIALIDNNVFPMGSDEIETIADEHGVKMKYLRDAAFGTDTLKSYHVKFSGESGQLDSFVDRLAQEDGIEFRDTKLEESHDETDMNNPEEKREVELAKKAKAAAEEILKMHGK